MKDYKNMDVWNESRKLVKKTYEVTKKFPKEERFGLTSQAQRSAVSQFSNISEGLGRKYKKETIHFLSDARGSLYELDAQMIAALDQKYISETEYKEILNQIELVLRLVNGTITYYENAKLK